MVCSDWMPSSSQYGYPYNKQNTLLFGPYIVLFLERDLGHVNLILEDIIIKH